MKWRTLADGALRDARYALRTARRNPGFAAVAILSLALGIGANSAIFTFVDAALLKPLPYRAADRIVALLQRPLNGEDATNVHPRSFVEWHDRAQSFEALAIAQPIPVNTSSEDGAEQVPGLWTTAAMFRVFGVVPFLGRTFTDEEGFGKAAVRGDPAGERSVAILSHGYWQRRFGGDRAVLGRSFPIGRGSAVVIGVMPAGFTVGTLNADVYLPLPLNRSAPEAVGSRSFLCFGLLRDGVDVSTAQAELAVIADRVGRQHASEKEWGVLVLALRDYLVRDHRRILLVLASLVALVLLIACANLAGLLLARGVERRGELALRAALGASRGTLVRQLLVESLVLSLVGGVLGVAVAAWASRALTLLAQDAVPFGQIADAQLDARVLAFTAILSIGAALVSGLLPAWQISRVAPHAALKQHGWSGGSGRGQQRLRAALVTAEVAACVVLLVGAGLLLQTFSNLVAVEPGFQTEDALTMRMLVTGDASRRSNLVERLLDRVEAVPGVRAVGTIQFLPLSGWTNNGPFHFVGRPLPVDPKAMETDVSTVSRGYFDAMGIPVLRGRPFARQDGLEAPSVAVVNQAFVRRYSAEEDPIGRIILGDWANPKPTEIVGVVANTRHNGLTADARPTIFLAQSQVPGYITYIVVRTAIPPEPMAAAIRSELRQVDPALPITDVQPLQRYVSVALARPRLLAVLLWSFAALALVLAGIGLYGLIGYAIRRRTREIGIRMALGARPGDMMRSTLAYGARLVSMGLVVGIACSIASSRFVASLLFGISDRDPLTYTGAAMVLAVVALLAIYGPARRASRVDPLIALKAE